jgi:transcriptional regulator with XRE-family HTH domain
MTIEDAFGTVLREFRVSRGVTQEKLGFDAELDRTFISLLERGQRQPSLATIFQLSRALGLSPTQIVQRVEDKLNAAGKDKATSSLGPVR